MTVQPSAPAGLRATSGCLPAAVAWIWQSTPSEAAETKATAIGVAHNPPALILPTSCFRLHPFGGVYPDAGRA
jgi:hypothetical protein